MDIFKDNNLYPKYNNSVIKHYANCFNTVYVGLNPFYKVNNYSLKGSIPEDEIILENGHIIYWKEIIKNTSLKDFRDVNKALITSIGGLKKNDERQDLLKILNEYTIKNDIWDPSEGMFEIFTKKNIFDVLNFNKITYVTIKDEHYENQKELNLAETSFKEFANSIDTNDFFIYSKNREILFSIDWDYFFFFIAFDYNNIDKLNIETNFEGFYANETTTHSWAWDKEIKAKKINFWKRFF